VQGRQQRRRRPVRLLRVGELIPGARQNRPRGGPSSSKDPASRAPSPRAASARGPSSGPASSRGPASRGGGPRPPSSRRARARGRKRRAAAIALGAVTAIAVAFFATLALLARQAGPGGGRPIALEVPPGATAGDVGRLLAEAGGARSAFLASAYLGVFGDARRIAPGPHLVDDGWSLSQVRVALERDPGRARGKVVIPEGLHRFAVAERLEGARVCAREAFLAASVDPMLLEALDVPAPPGATPESAEGFLFPATYEIPVDTPAPDVVRRLVGESHTRWTRVARTHAEGIARLERDLGWGRREIVTLASMVEKETGAAEERPLVAAVFLNRLRDPAFTPKLLQSDPTAGYGCVRDRSVAPSCAGYEGRVTGAMNRDRLNAYSTYVREGLPPGPIANPGEASIAAVLAPADAGYLYFVASGQGRHRFSTTYDDHRRAIRGEAPAEPPAPSAAPPASAAPAASP